MRIRRRWLNKTTILFNILKSDERANESIREIEGGKYMDIDWRRRIDIFAMVLAVFALLMKIATSAAERDMPMLVFSTILGVTLVPSWIKAIKELIE